MAKSIGNTIAEIYYITLIDKLIFKCQDMIRILTRLFADLCVLSIAYFSPISDPPNISFFMFNHRENCWLHAIFKQGEFFWHINKVKFNIRPFWYVSYTKEEPLIIAFGVNVVLENQIILIYLPLINSVEIAWLEIWVKIYRRPAEYVIFLCPRSISQW